MRKEMEVSTDIMFVNKPPFLVRIRGGMKFTTIEYLSIKDEKSLVTSINKIVSYFKSHGLHVGTMFVDPEFQFLEGNVVITTANKTGAREHVPEVERQIQVIKERIQAHHSNPPFPSFTRWTTIELAKHVVMFLNTFPPKSGLSKTDSPHTIMTGKYIDWKKSYKLHFGSYVKVH